MPVYRGRHARPADNNTAQSNHSETEDFSSPVSDWPTGLDDRAQSPLNRGDVRKGHARHAGHSAHSGCGEHDAYDSLDSFDGFDGDDGYGDADGFDGQGADMHAVRSFTVESRKPRSILGRVVAIIVVIAVIAGLSTVALYLAGVLPTPDDASVAAGQPVTVNIPEGASTSEIAALLRKANVITDENAFKNAVVSRNAASSLKSGIYPLKTKMDLTELVSALIAGPSTADTGNRLTVPEGLSVEQTAAIVEQSCGIPANEFVALAYSADRYAADYPFLTEVYNNSLEGFLYPKTYTIPQSANADYVIRVLLDQFALETKDLNYALAASKNLTPYDLLILASLIEKETAQPDERPLVSSVIYNRLRVNMRLQIDATVVYALGPSYDGSPLLNKDLEIDSPYNTYRIDELPVGPICSPQIASLAAAADPAQTDYLYYVLTSRDGTHTFCATSDEFEQAKRLYQEVFGIS
ncbi:MAG: endolytic transglycosylase MltG [Coriobacteriales bacterium]|jgi:UPF0755 protein|nr:endolytic transglycosylase MltG [Coriobacteriales bacterium]